MWITPTSLQIKELPYLTELSLIHLLQPQSVFVQESRRCSLSPSSVERCVFLYEEMSGETERIKENFAGSCFGRTEHVARFYSNIRSEPDPWNRDAESFRFLSSSGRFCSSAVGCRTQKRTWNRSGKRLLFKVI